MPETDFVAMEIPIHLLKSWVHVAMQPCRKNAAKGESDFDRLDVAELLLDRVLYNVQAAGNGNVTSQECLDSDPGKNPGGSGWNFASIVRLLSWKLVVMWV